MKRTFLRLVPVVALACGFLVGCGAAGAELSTDPGGGGDGGTGPAYGGAGGGEGGQSATNPTNPRAGGNGAEKAADLSVPQNGVGVQALPECTSTVASIP